MIWSLPFFSLISWSFLFTCLAPDCPFSKPDLRTIVLLVPLPRMFIFIQMVSSHLSNLESNVTSSEVKHPSFEIPFKKDVHTPSHSIPLEFFFLSISQCEIIFSHLSFLPFLSLFPLLLSLHPPLSPPHFRLSVSLWKGSPIIAEAWPSALSISQYLGQGWIDRRLVCVC